jgi:hypothetical protein
MADPRHLHRRLPDEPSRAESAPPAPSARRITSLARLFAVLTILLWISSAGHAAAQSPAQLGTATATLSSPALAVGAVGFLEVSATFRSAPQWVEIDLGPLSPAFEVRRVKSGGAFGTRRRWTIEIAAFEPGPALVPPLAVNGALANGLSGSLASTPAVEVEITSPAVSASDPLQPLIERLDPPPLPAWLRVTAVVVPGTIALAAVVALSRSMRRFLTRRRRRREFWRATLAALRQLADQAGGAAGEQRRSTLHAAAGVIKTALAAALDRRVRGRSSADVHAILSEQPKHQKVRDRSAAIFDSLDRQRFGPKRPTESDDNPLPDAVAMVERLPKRLRSEDAR